MNSRSSTRSNKSTSSRGLYNDDTDTYSTKIDLPVPQGFHENAVMIKSCDEAKRYGEQFQKLKRRLEACRETRCKSFENLKDEKSLMYFQEQLDQANKKLGEIENNLMDHHTRYERRKAQIQEEYQAKLAKLNERLEKDMRQIEDSLEYNLRLENSRKASQDGTVMHFKANVARCQEKITNNVRSKTKEEILIEKEIQDMYNKFIHDDRLKTLLYYVKGIEEFVQVPEAPKTNVASIPSNEKILETTDTTVSTTITTTKTKRTSKKSQVSSPAPAIIVEKKVKEIVYPDSDEEEDYELPFDVKLSADNVPSYSYKYLNDPEVPKYSTRFLVNGNLLIIPYGFDDPSYGDNEEGIPPEEAYGFTEEETISKIYWDQEYITNWVNKQIQKILLERSKQEAIEKAVYHQRELERRQQLEKDKDRIANMSEEELHKYILSMKK
jgi:hypothetical protein